MKYIVILLVLLSLFLIFAVGYNIGFSQGDASNHVEVKNAYERGLLDTKEILMPYLGIFGESATKKFKSKGIDVEYSEGDKLIFEGNTFNGEKMANVMSPVSEETFKLGVECGMRATDMNIDNPKKYCLDIMRGLQ